MAERLALQWSAEVLDYASKYAFHSKRCATTVADLRLAGGLAGPGDAMAPWPQLLRVQDAADLLCRAEIESIVAEGMPAARLPSGPLEVGVAPHWLAIDGVQPATVENAQPWSVMGTRRSPPVMVASAMRTRPPAPPDGGGLAVGVVPFEEARAVPVSLPLKHSMPEELQLYFNLVRQALQSKSGSLVGRSLAPHAVAASLATDPGLQPMLPYLVPLLADEVGRNLGDAEQLEVVLSAMRGLLSNARLHMLPYIHHLLPAIMTCLVARQIGTGDKHWAIRDKAAAIVALIIRQTHHDAMVTALARMQHALTSAMFADAPSTQYGSLVGLTALGAPVLIETLLPRLNSYEPLFEDEAQTPISVHVRAALVVALGRCMSWGNGRHAGAILSSVPNTGSAFWAALQAVAPAGHVHI